MAQDDFLVTSSSGNHGLACSDAMKRFFSSKVFLNTNKSPRYDLKGSIIVPSNVSIAKRKKLEMVGAKYKYIYIKYKIYLYHIYNI